MNGITHIVPIDKSEKKFGFDSGIYIGSGAATAAIISTGLAKVESVWMSKVLDAYAAATADAGYMPKPCKAAGTPGSFYPLIGYIDKGAAVNHTLGIGAAATFRWVALGT